MIRHCFLLALATWRLAAASSLHPTAILVVGTEPDAPLFADRVFKERMELFGFEVTVIRDKEVTGADCEAADAMLVSSSIGGNNVLHRLDNCTKPQIIWEVGIFQFNGMSAETNADAWVTSHWWNTYHQDAWKDGAWPAAPTGNQIQVTLSGFSSPLAAGALPGMVDFFEDADPQFGMNWVFTDKLGPGAEVIALLPQGPGLPDPQRPKATYFVYPKGAELYGGRGPSPALRIGFPPYGFVYGADPTCEELKEVPPCAQCQGHCMEKDDLIKSGQATMKLTPLGLKMLDAAIEMIGGKPPEFPVENV